MVLADDFARGVALDARGAAVPTDHAAVHVEHEDRIIHHALDQEAELPFALTQSALDFLASLLVRCCEIVRHGPSSG
jgi:hypothetical protein